MSQSAKQPAEKGARRARKEKKIKKEDRPKAKRDDDEEYSSSDEQYDSFQEDSRSARNPRGRRNKRSISELASLKGQPIGLISASTISYLCSQEGANKMIGSLILDESGRVYYANKTGNEHFEGYLNSFESRPIWFCLQECSCSLLIKRFNEQMNTSEKLVFMIYSKNSKRKYDLVPALNRHNRIDYYFRYMKCLTASIKCFNVDFSGYEHLEGFWNKKLIERSNRNEKYYYMETMLTDFVDSLEIIKGCDFHNDPVIRKFQAVAHAKKQQKQLLPSICAKGFFEKITGTPLRNQARPSPAPQNNREPEIPHPQIRHPQMLEQNDSSNTQNQFEISMRMEEENNPIGPELSSSSHVEKTRKRLKPRNIVHQKLHEFELKNQRNRRRLVQAKRKNKKAEKNANQNESNSEKHSESLQNIKEQVEMNSPYIQPDSPPAGGMGYFMIDPPSPEGFLSFDNDHLMEDEDCLFPRPKHSDYFDRTPVASQYEIKYEEDQWEEHDYFHN